MKYAGFWKRFSSFWVDAIIIVPLIAFTFWGQNQSRLFNLYYFVPGLLFGLFYNVYLVGRYGGTPGKLLLNIKIAKVDGKEVGYRDAFFRNVVTLTLSVFSSAAIIVAVLNMTDVEYFSLGWQERALAISEQAPSWNILVTWLSNIWIWSEFVVMLTNEKRRALHDFIAGTVVIHS